MHLNLYLLLYLLFLPKILNKVVEIKCPQHCKCDIFENLKRATCSNKNLAKMESNFPKQTQFLDLSYNLISSLDDNVFKEENLLNLKLLNMSHNNLHDIHMNAFNGLTQLKTLDLSYNGVQYILKNWFWSMDSLQELYLRGNNLDKLDNGPIFTSKSLKKLDFSDCRIYFIGPDTFTELTSLEILDISGNYLINLNIAIVTSLPNLNILNVNKTQLECDNNQFKKLLKYCTQTGIRFVHPCGKKNIPIEKFQRMINMAAPEDEKNSWIYDDEEEIKNGNETKIINPCNITHVDKSLLQEIVDLSPVLSIILPFIYGIAVGILIVYIMNTFRKKNDLSGSTYMSFDEGNSHLQRRRSSRLSRIGDRFNRSYSTEDRQQLPLREWNLSESTPVLFRKNQIHI